MLSSEGRVVMVSGASRGIGREVVRQLLAAGYRVSAGVRNPATMSDLAESPRLHVSRYDATRHETADTWVAETVAAWGRIDGIVNAAGINPRVTVFGADPTTAENANDDEDPLNQMWRVNVRGPLKLVRAAHVHLAASGSGRVVTLGSLAGKRVASNVGYAISKFAVVALSHGIRREGRAAGIRATVICPGYVATDMTAGETEIARTEMTQPEDIAALVLLALALPNNAAVSELLVHCQYEPML